MAEYNIQQAQYEYYSEISRLNQAGIFLNESQEAVIFAKILVRQTTYSNEYITFCTDNEMYVSKTPTGYDVVGYYIDNRGTRQPFNTTVCKVNGQWYPAKRYVAADTKSCSSVIVLWILLMLGCSVGGVLMYYFISAMI